MKVWWPKVMGALCLMLVCVGCSDEEGNNQSNTPDMMVDMVADQSPDMLDMSVDMVDMRRDQASDMMDLVVLCEANQRVVSGACQACPAGSTNEAGDDPNLNMDTSCDAVLCEVDQFVQSNSCQSCAAGSTNEAGDDASGEDTQCDAVLCVQDHRVQMNRCVPCAAGLTNAAGDDPTGADTQCEDACVAVFGVACGSIKSSYLKSSNTGANDQFGFAVALDGETLVVGAPFEASNAQGVNGVQTDDSAPSSGAAYVFVQQNGQWTQQAYLKASNAEANDAFGYAVAISGETIVVGAYNEASNAQGVNGDQIDNSAGGSGAVYVFDRQNGQWSQSAYVKASNAETNDAFGISVDISGNALVVGAFNEASSATGVNGDQMNNAIVGSGAAYVFERQNGQWTQQAYLKASNPELNDLFGNLVAISEGTIIVGAYGESSSAAGVNGNQMDNSAVFSGAVYVFERQNGQWSQAAYLKASNPGANDSFGYDAAISGDTIVVGALSEASNATGVNGNQTDDSAEGSGAAYVFVRQNGQWTQQAYLKASNTGDADGFGVSVDVFGDTVVVGGWEEASSATGINGNQMDDSSPKSGAVYVFRRDNGAWRQHVYLKASPSGAGDWFGFATAVSGQTIVTGAYAEASDATGVGGNAMSNAAPRSGAVYTFSP